MTSRLGAVVATALVAICVAGCGQEFMWENLATGTFDGGKMVALNWFRGTNSNQGTITLEAYANVSDQTPGTLDISGPQHWRCVGVFSVPSDLPGGGPPYQSTRDKVASLPGMHGSFTGPTGTYRVTIEIPSKSVNFGHTWKWFDWFAPETPSGALALYRNYHGPGSPVCTQVVDSLLLQRSLADGYLDRLQGMLDYPNWAVNFTGSPLHAQFEALLNQARQAKISGDGRADPAARTAEYQSCAAILTKMAQLARDTVVPPNPPWDLAPGTRIGIIDLATEAIALLSIAELS